MSTGGAGRRLEDPRAAGAKRKQSTTADPPELRPLEADLVGLPPVHVIAGGEEVLLGDSDRLVSRIPAAGVDYLRADGIELLRSGVRTLAVRPDAATRYDAEIQQRLARTVWTACHNWYRTATGRIVNNWPGTMREYARRTRRFEVADYAAHP